MTGLTRADAEALDRDDPLAPLRARFRLPNRVIYLDGNSLGPLPADTPARLSAIVEQEWGERLIRSWNEADWIGAPRRIGDKIAPIVGAPPGTVLATDGSTSTALYKLIVAGAALGPGAILAESDNFPTDIHIAEEAARLLGRPFRMAPGADIAAALDGVAIAIITHVNYRTGARHDMAALNRAAQAGATRIIWDLSHSAGAVPLDLAGNGAALAIGCSYKFLNGGPGAPAWLYVAEELQDHLRSPIAGWWGHAAPFAFSSTFAPASGVARFQGGTPQMLSLLAIEPALDLFAGLDMGALWDKSVRLFDLFADRMAALAPDLACVSPRDPAKRGSQIAFAHPHAYELIQALIAQNVIGDYREPGIARFGLTPLYTRFVDVWDASETLGGLLASGAWQRPEFAIRTKVT